ncbi:UNVERIFIED_CONTAM: putative electron transfer flavoprotein subunit [Siphonaria sp. JEL0065]|nr:putative electron transfer flavoprotein subunit [Siphonaria sp. JEL0065]
MNPAAFSLDHTVYQVQNAFDGDQFLTTLLGSGSFTDYFAIEHSTSPHSLDSPSASSPSDGMLGIEFTGSTVANAISVSGSTPPASDPFGSFVIPSDTPSIPLPAFGPVSTSHSVIGDYELAPSAYSAAAFTAACPTKPIMATTNESIDSPKIQRTKPRRRPRADTPKAMKAIAKMVATMDAAEVGASLSKADQKKLRAYNRNLVCADCGSTSTPLWRKGSDGRHLCNACGLYFLKYNTSRSAASMAVEVPAAAAPVTKDNGWTIKSHLASFPSKSTKSQATPVIKRECTSDTFMRIPAAAPSATKTSFMTADEVDFNNNFMASLLYSAEQGFVASSAKPVSVANFSTAVATTSSATAEASTAWDFYEGGDQAVLDDYFWLEEEDN